MKPRFDPGERHPGVEAHLAEIPPSLLDDRTWYATELCERYATEVVLEATATLGLAPELARGGTAPQILARRGFVAGFLPLLGALFARLASAGVLEAEGDPPSYRATRSLPASAREELRREAIERDPALEPALALLDVALASYAGIATGQTTGEQALLQPARVGLWLAYFDNANPVYALSNRIAAVAAANRLPKAGPFRVLELGAGAGSAAEALLEELERRGRLDEIELYRLTEPSPFFRRRAERALRARFPTVRFDSRALDIDQPFEEQGVGGGHDLVYGVNVVHVARRLDASLARMRAALEPGGALVAGECIRLFPGQPVPADLVFQLLHGFTSVETDPALRPHHGFLELETWRRAFAAGGFDPLEVVPDLERLRALHPRFFAGALCVRRPVESSAPEAT